MSIPKKWVKIAENENAVVYKTHTMLVPTVTGDYGAFANDYKIARLDEYDIPVFEVDVYKIITKNHKFFDFDECAGGYTPIMNKFNRTNEEREA